MIFAVRIEVEPQLPFPFPSRNSQSGALVQGVVAIPFVFPGGVTDGDLQIVPVAILLSNGGKFRALNDDLRVGGDCESALASASCSVLLL